MNEHLSDKYETGKLGIYYLKRIWSFYMNGIVHGNSQPEDQVEWKYVNATFNALGIGLEPTIKFLLSVQPDFEEFENWILRTGVVDKDVIVNFNTIIKSENNTKYEIASVDSNESVLDEQDLLNWEKNGYVILKSAISFEACEETKNEIYNFIGAKEEDSESWYLDHPSKQGIMVQLFSSDRLNQNRLSKRIKIAYQQLWQRSDLLVSMDRVSFNPPETNNYHFPGPILHWDVSLKQPIPFGLQGLLYLTDTSAKQGAFTLVPGFHKKIDSWLDNLPNNVNPRNIDFDQFETKSIEGEAGDFIIWHQALPHGSSPNLAKKPRIVQYINYQPLDMKFEDEWV